MADDGMRFFRARKVSYGGMGLYETSEAMTAVIDAASRAALWSDVHEQALSHCSRLPCRLGTPTCKDIPQNILVP